MARIAFDRAETARFPQESGVYIFLDAQGKPLYVGKATNLRARVRSYFNQNSDGRLVTYALADTARWMDFIVTDSAKEALILENSLIKKHAPRFNIKLRDDKTYFSLRLDLSHEWPRLTVVRKRKKDDALYFGPYPSAHACRKTIQYLNGIFPLRTCADSVLYNRTRPCLSHEIGRCVAPCVGLTDQETYRALIDRVIRFLRGQDKEILAELEAEMKEAASRLEFERAAEIRDRLQHIRRTLEQPQVARRGGIDRDVIGVYESGDEIVLAVLQVRDGSLAASSSFTFRRLAEVPLLLASFLGQFYSPPRTPPPEIILPEACEDRDLYQEILEDKRGGAVDLRVPQRGEALRLLELAERNAELSAQHKQAGDAETRSTLQSLQDELGLVHFPESIECFDVSHLAGTNVVASCVHFRDGRPEKGRYRHYKLKEVQRNDDFAAMEEVLQRRLRRGLDEGDLPDLLVIDGGPPQLRRVVAVMRELQVDGCDVVGLAKARREGRGGASPLRRFERAWLPDREAPLVLPESAPHALLLQRVRNEAHRFAIGYNRSLRAKEGISSVLEMVPGVGPRRTRALLRHFGSLAAVKQADHAALASAPAMNPQVATAILDFFREQGRNPPS